MPGYGQSLGAALGQLAFGGGDPERSKSGMKGMLDGAHAGAYEASAKQSLAQALKAQADAANTNAQTGILTNRGANVDMSMAAESGVPMPQINAFRDYLKTGVKPMSSATGDMQTDEAIGIAPAPTFDNGVMAKLAPLMKRNLPYLTNVGDIKIDDAAQADATYNTTGLINRVAGGGKQGDAVRALLAAKGKAEFDNLGGNGVFSGVDGGQQLNAVGTSAAGENVARAGSANASAANSYASAGQHKASTDKIRQEITQGGKSGQTQIITDAAGNVTLVDKVTGQARPAMYADGRTVSGKTAAEKPLPEGAQKQLVGTRNLQDAVDQYQAALTGWSNQKMLDPNQRAMMGNAYNNMMLQAKEAYNLGVLNGPDYDILQSVVKDPTKAGSAMVTNDTLKGQADSLKKIAGNIERTVLESHNKPYTPRINPNAPAPGGVLSVTSADDYAKVPSGATYTTPDGKTRKKP